MVVTCTGSGIRELESFRPPLRCHECLAVMTSGDWWLLGRYISKFYDVWTFNGQVSRISVCVRLCVCVFVTQGQKHRYFHHVEPSPKSWICSKMLSLLAELHRCRVHGSELGVRPRLLADRAWSETTSNTLRETNIAPENQWLEDEFPFEKAYFQGLC